MVQPKSSHVKHPTCVHFHMHIAACSYICNCEHSYDFCCETEVGTFISLDFFPSPTPLYLVHVDLKPNDGILLIRPRPGQRARRESELP